MSLSFTWLGHSTFVLEVAGKVILMDPFITNNPLANIDLDALMPDAILLTHAHHDHVGDTDAGVAYDTITIAQQSGAEVFTNFEIANYLGAHGIENIHGGNTGGTLSNDWLDVKFTKAFHSSSFGDGTYGGQPHGLVIRAGGYTLYNAGDTTVFGDMAFIGEEGIDVAFLPIGDSFTMGIDDSIRATRLVKPKYVVPMHYNTFPPIVQDAAIWAKRINRETDAQPIVIDPGKPYILD